MTAKSNAVRRSFICGLPLRLEARAGHFAVPFALEVRPDVSAFVDKPGPYDLAIQFWMRRCAGLRHDVTAIVVVLHTVAVSNQEIWPIAHVAAISPTTTASTRLNPEHAGKNDNQQGSQPPLILRPPFEFVSPNKCTVLSCEGQDQ